MDRPALQSAIQHVLDGGVRRVSLPEHMKFAGYSDPVDIPAERLSLLVHHLENEPEMAIFQNRNFNCGTSRTTINLNYLAHWLIASALDHGVADTVDHLERYMNIDYNPASEIMAVYGIKIAEQIEVSEGLFFVPLQELPPSLAKEAIAPRLLEPVYATMFGIPLPINSGVARPRAALVRKVKLKPKTFSADENFGNIDTVMEEFLDIWLCLTLVGPSTPLPGAHWYQLDDWVPFSGQLGGGWSEPLHDVIGAKYTEITADGIAALSELYNLFSFSERKAKESLRVSLARLNQSMRRWGHVDRAIDLGIALEALLLNDRSPQDPLSLPFRLRGAWLLGASKGERSDLYSLFDNLYTCRSVAVHTGKLDGLRLKPIKGRRMNTDDVLDLGTMKCKDAIERIIRGGFPDWNSLILGE